MSARIPDKFDAFVSSMEHIKQAAQGGPITSDYQKVYVKLGENDHFVTTDPGKKGKVSKGMKADKLADEIYKVVDFAVKSETFAKKSDADLEKATQGLAVLRERITTAQSKNFVSQFLKFFGFDDGYDKAIADIDKSTGLLNAEKLKRQEAAKLQEVARTQEIAKLNKTNSDLLNENIDLNKQIEKLTEKLNDQIHIDRIDQNLVKPHHEKVILQCERSLDRVLLKEIDLLKAQERWQESLVSAEDDLRMAQVAFNSAGTDDKRRTKNNMISAERRVSSLREGLKTINKQLGEIPNERASIDEELNSTRQLLMRLNEKHEQVIPNIEKEIEQVQTKIKANDALIAENRSRLAIINRMAT